VQTKSVTHIIGIALLPFVLVTTQAANAQTGCEAQAVLTRP
jgi:hypothetical protein